MLRHKLLFTLFGLAALLMALAIVAVLVLQSFLADLEHVDTTAVELRGPVIVLSDDAREDAQEERLALTRRLRWLVSGLAVAFLLVINASVMLLLRSGSSILHAVDKLVEASRQLAMERFDYRVTLDRHDEFDELARAYNKLAEQLQENEKLKIDSLHQTALMLNHELNNAMTIIELQLQLLKRRGSDQASSEKSLRQIHERLQQMAEVIDKLKHVRRVVLTDYIDGVKMLDLQESMRDEPLTVLRDPT
jgi:signal transduction histidine kinase